jgi:hypothetical protein
MTYSGISTCDVRIIRSVRRFSNHCATRAIRDIILHVVIFIKVITDIQYVYCKVVQNVRFKYISRMFLCENLKILFMLSLSLSALLLCTSFLSQPFFVSLSI